MPKTTVNLKEQNSSALGIETKNYKITDSIEHHISTQWRHKELYFKFPIDLIIQYFKYFLLRPRHPRRCRNLPSIIQTQAK